MMMLLRLVDPTKGLTLLGKTKLPQSKNLCFHFVYHLLRDQMKEVIVTREIKKAQASRHIQCEECEGTYPLAAHSSVCSNPLYSSPPRHDKGNQDP